jgi:VanZ family protein
VALAVTAVILHGSLYPYEFRLPPGTAGPVSTLLSSWTMRSHSLGEMIANVLLYAPFGFFAALAIRGPHRLLIVTLLGLVLCTAVELAQFYDVGRVTSLSDVCLNTAGTVLGGLAAGGIRFASGLAMFGPSRARPVPLILLAAMLGYHLYPYVPVIDLHKYWHSVKPLLVRPVAGPLAIFHYFTLWLAICYLIADAAVRSRSGFLVLCLAVFVFGAKILIVNQSLSPAEAMGAAAAIFIWLAILERMSWRAAIVAVLLCAMIVVLRLEPFHFRAPAGHFGWLPFQGYLTGSFGINVQSFLEKAFLYGSLVWIAARAGLDLPVATAATATLCLATSIAEIYLPGRSAEITDAFIALLMGVVFIAMTGSRINRRRRDSLSAPPSRRRFS